MPIVSTNILLAQRKPAATQAVRAYNPPANTIAEINLIYIANHGNASTTYSIFHDKHGSGVVKDNALYYSVPLSANMTTYVTFAKGSGIFLESADSKISVQTGSPSDLTFTFYGTETQIT